MANIIFLIGPGGAGKTTCGRLLAKQINYQFIDLDSEFMDRVGHIGTFIKEQGYDEYCRENSRLFYDLTASESTSKTVLALSSGFLTYKVDGLKDRHLSDLKRLGLSVMIMPAKTANECQRIIVDRQMNRGFGLIRKNEEEKILERFEIYRSLGDVQIFSSASPESIAKTIVQQLIVASKPFDGLI